MKPNLPTRMSREQAFLVVAAVAVAVLGFLSLSTLSDREGSKVESPRSESAASRQDSIPSERIQIPVWGDAWERSAGKQASVGRRQVGRSPVKGRTLALEDSRAAVIRGRCIDASGVPLVGVRVALEAEYDDTVLWSSSKVQRTKSHGRFEFRFTPRASGRFELRAAIEGCIGLHGTWNHIEAGTMKDLGDCALIRGCRVSGTVTDVDGRPAGAAIVRFEHRTPKRQPGEFRPRVMHRVRAKDDGSFELDDRVGSGEWTVHVSDRERAFSAGMEIEPRDRERFFELDLRSDKDR